MESIRVDVCYRPLRIGWAISAGDFQAFRTAVRTSYALWGGRFNPIIIVDQQKQADDLVNLFRLDLILPISDSEAVRAFSTRFSYLIRPFHNDRVFMGSAEYGNTAHVLDVYNALTHLHQKPEWETFKKREVQLYKWKPNDPLADVFLMHFGGYPSVDEAKIDYREFVKNIAEATEIEIEPTSRLRSDAFQHPSISFLSRYAVERHYTIQGGWDGPGFYSGDAANLADLVSCWNLRAADVPVLFVDPSHLDRYGEAIDAWHKMIRQMVSGRRSEFERDVSVWATVDDAANTMDGMDKILKPFEGKASRVYRLNPDTWSGGAVRPPMMYFREVSTLGIVGASSGTPQISFALEQKPFNGDNWFHLQMLVASVSFIGGLYGDERHTLVPPFAPELNEFYGRAISFDHTKVRSEPQRIGLIINASDTSKTIRALAVGDLIEAIFDLSGFSSRLSEAGLIARQLIAQLGGVDRARAFKIPGVRRLLKTYNPTESFTKKGAVQLIGCNDPNNPGASFKDHEDLYIEPRPGNEKLTPQDVFAFLVEKRLFRVGAQLRCPNCRLFSWTALDVLKQRVTCELCGQEFDSTRQIINEDWHYRRSGVLGKDKNAQGAIPVILTLQQFNTNLPGPWNNTMYSPSLELAPKTGFDLPQCEIDFIWLTRSSIPDRTAVILGECKDGGANEKGGGSGMINAEDIDNLRRVAGALPRNRFETYIVLAKLCPFTTEEIALAKTLTDRHRRHVILLTARELEPYHFFDRTKLEFKDIRPYGNSVEELAATTYLMYFSNRSRS